MKIIFRISVILIIILSGFIVKSCKKDKPTIPVLTTTTVSGITATTATSGGIITSDGGAPITANGVCWSTGISPTIGDSKTADGTGTGSFASNITGLTANTKYYVRAYATNNAGTAYGSEQNFTTILTVTDIDANVYNTLTIGTQTWLKENLKTTKYKDGTAIQLVTVDQAWSILKTGAYCWYDNYEAGYKNLYGALYNWYAVNTGKLCPAGWHVPTDAEWTTLISYLGGVNTAGDKLKEPGTSHWLPPNTGANNSSGFTALPGGYRYEAGAFEYMGNYGYWWSSTEAATGYAWHWSLNYVNTNVGRISNYTTQNGLSVRCLKDN
jgi:uncharacterized protein (TIGR02145 family)